MFYRKMLALLVVAAFSAAASSQTLKIGVLNDQSGVQADFAGPGSVIAAKMAVAD